MILQYSNTPILHQSITPSIHQSITPQIHPMLSINQLSKRFEHVQALDQVSLTIAPGELCGLLGANGAGKSTLFKTLMGLLQADSGEFSLAGAPIRFGEVEYKRQIGYSPESPVFYEYLTARSFSTSSLRRRAEGRTRRVKRRSKDGSRFSSLRRRPTS